MKIIVKNWSKFQHYKDRNPPWIKLHKTLLDDCEFNCLHDASKWLAFRIWMIASEYQDGIINASERQIAFRLRMTPDQLISGLSELQNAGFIEFNNIDSGVLALCSHDAVPETETETETETDIIVDAVASTAPYRYSEEFNSFWECYPNKKSGKSNAFGSWKKKVVANKVDPSVVMSGLLNHINSKDWLKQNGEFIPLATTWLNQSRWDAELGHSSKLPEDVVLFTRWWSYAFNMVSGGDYLIPDGSADLETLLRLVSSIGLRPLLWRACAYFISNDNTRPKTISRFEWCLNELTPIGKDDVPKCQALGLLPSDGIRIEDWKFWEVTNVD